MKQLLGPLETYFQHIELLHQGATVVTYTAEQLSSATVVVIKMLDFKKIQAWKALELFEREARVLQGLSHPAIPEYIDAFQAEYEGHAYYCLVQKKVTGQTLQHWIDSEHRFTETEIKDLAAQLLEVLVYLHSFNPPIIHRDIKPDNLIWHDHILSVLDFGGVLKHLGPSQSTVVGTYGYMAPEQFQGKARIESDLYSVGMTLAHALSHIHPSNMESYGLSINIVPYLKCSAGLLDWLRALIALLPEERFPSAQKALVALRKLNNAPLIHHSRLRPPSLLDTLSTPTHNVPKDVYSPSISSDLANLADLADLALLPSKQQSARALASYTLEQQAQKTVLKTQGKNEISTRIALKIDLFVTLPGVVMLGLLKLAGYTWVQAALWPSLLLLPIVAFFLLMARFSKLELEITPDGLAYKKRLGPFTLQTHEAELKGSHFRTHVLGAVIKIRDPEAPSVLKLIDDETAEERVLHMGLPLETYAYIAATLNGDIHKFETAPDLLT